MYWIDVYLEKNNCEESALGRKQISIIYVNEKSTDVLVEREEGIGLRMYSNICCGTWCSNNGNSRSL